MNVFEAKQLAVKCYGDCKTKPDGPVYIAATNNDAVIVNKDFSEEGCYLFKLETIDGEVQCELA